MPICPFYCNFEGHNGNKRERERDLKSQYYVKWIAIFFKNRPKVWTLWESDAVEVRLLYCIVFIIFLWTIVGGNCFKTKKGRFEFVSEAVVSPFQMNRPKLQSPYLLSKSETTPLTLDHGFNSSVYISKVLVMRSPRKYFIFKCPFARYRRMKWFRNSRPPIKKNRKIPENTMYRSCSIYLLRRCPIENSRIDYVVL